MPHRLVICTPSASGLKRVETDQGSYALWREAIQLGFQTGPPVTVQKALIWKARRDLYRLALENHADYLLFMDDDMVPPPRALTALYTAIQQGPWAIVSGLCVLRSEQGRFSVSWRDPDGIFDDQPSDLPGEDVMEVNGFGMAFCLLDLARCQRITGIPDQKDARKNPFFPFLLEDSPNGLGEDLAFCHRIRAGGGRLALHGGVHPGHLFLLELKAGPIIQARREMLLAASIKR